MTRIIKSTDKNLPSKSLKGKNEKRNVKFTKNGEIKLFLEAKASIVK